MAKRRISFSRIGILPDGGGGWRGWSRGPTEGAGGEGALLAAVNAKLEDGNIRAAVRILCDGAPPAIPNEQNLKLLMEKHPFDPDPVALGRLPTPDASGSWQVTPAEVLRAVRTFPAGSAAGPDGFRPGHLGDLVGFGGESEQLVGALTDFINLLLRGDCPQEVRPILFGGNMIALNKDKGGLRPIAVGYIWRRLAAKCANRYAVARLTAHFAPLQLGIGVPGGCEAAVHATRRFIGSMRPDQVLVKLDFANAFNTLRRDVMLEAVHDSIPELYPFVHQAYSAPSVLKFGHLLLSSQMGPQQGDPLGPLLFSLPLQPVLHSLESDLRVGFLDDLTLGGEVGAVARDVHVMSELGSTPGLCLNPSKCEILTRDSGIALPPELSGYPGVELTAVSLLGAPLFRGSALDESLGHQCDLHLRAFGRMQGLPSQNALILLRSSFGASRVNYLLRCSPCHEHPGLVTLDGLQRAGLESLVNCSVNDLQWLQATLPIRDGGLGIRRVVSLASSAYLASAASTLGLQSAILSRVEASLDGFVEALLEARRDSLPRKTSPEPTKQSLWNQLLVELAKAEVGRSDAACNPHSADWLSVLPIAACGLTLDNEAVRVALD